MLTEIRLRFSGRSHKLVSRSARFHIVQGEGFTNHDGTVPVTEAFPVDRPDTRVAAIVQRYARAAKPIGERVVGHLQSTISGSLDANGGQRLGELIADAQLAWARAPERGGAQVAFMNGGGVRTDLVPSPGGGLTYAQLFATQPYGNGLVVQTLTGAQLKELLEQQFANPQLLSPSAGFAFSYDPGRGAGQRILSMTLDDRSIDPAATYRVVTNTFMASGGDNYKVLLEGTGRRDVGVDIDALEAYIAGSPVIPVGDRVRKVASQSPPGDHPGR
jgi:5'-nucleotidase